MIICIEKTKILRTKILIYGIFSSPESKTVKKFTKTWKLKNSKKNNIYLL